MTGITAHSPKVVSVEMPAYGDATTASDSRNLDYIKLRSVHYTITVHMTSAPDSNEMHLGEAIWVQMFRNTSPDAQPAFDDIFFNERTLTPDNEANSDQHPRVGAFLKRECIGDYRILKRHRFMLNPNIHTVQAYQSRRDPQNNTYPHGQNFVSAPGTNRREIQGYLNFSGRRTAYVRFHKNQDSGKWIAIKTNGLLLYIVFSGRNNVVCEAHCRYRTSYYY